VKDRAVQHLFDTSALKKESCEKIISDSFEILLKDLETMFDENDGDWHHFEISDFLNSCRKTIK
jgi:hypothetical protein